MSRSFKHIEFPGEQWADLWEKPTADEVLKAQKALRSRLNTDQETEGVFAMELVLIKELHVFDEDGALVPLSRQGLGRAPGEIVTNLLFLECLEILKTALPNL